MPVVHQRSTSLTPPTTATATGTSQPPSLPPRPSTLNNPRPSANYYGNGPRLAPTPYGGIGGYNSYASPYSRFGGMGSSMYGGLGGGYGSMYGGIGGMGGMYGSMGGPGRMGMDPNDPNSLTNSFSQSTQATFQIIESLVGAFGGFAQMLESTYMATHSSFFGELVSIDLSRSRALTAFRSNGLCSRPVRQPSHHPWLHPRHLHPPALAAHPLRQNHRPTPTRRRNIAHPVRLCRFPWFSPNILLWCYADPLQKTFSCLPPRCFRSSLPPYQTHSFPRLAFAFDRHRCPRPRSRRYPSTGPSSHYLHPCPLEIGLLSCSLRLCPASDG